jgi:hypothetical protein
VTAIAGHLFKTIYAAPRERFAGIKEAGTHPWGYTIFYLVVAANLMASVSARGD